MSLIRSWAARAYRHFSPPAVDGWYRRIHLDYPVKPQPRWGQDGKPTHAKLAEIIERGHAQYEETLNRVLAYKDALVKINVTGPESSTDPRWVNGWIPALDTATLYSIVADRNPRTYLEVGSGNSTKFVRRAIEDQGLQTRIVSIDPQPRAEVDELCDEIHRCPMEEAAIELFDRLEPGDVLFVDSSHRCFPNSDVVAVFFDVLPRLPPDVLVEFHDIALPDDYPQGDCDVFYTEQYLLGAWLLADGPHLETMLPNHFISTDPELSEILDPLWKEPDLRGIERYGCSYWVRTR